MAASIWRVRLTETLIASSMVTAAAAEDLSPPHTVELLHKAMAEADATRAAALLHPDYRGVSLQGAESYGLFRDGGTWKIVSFADTDNALKGRSADEVCPDQ